MHASPTSRSAPSGLISRILATVGALVLVLGVASVASAEDASSVDSSSTSTSTPAAAVNPSSEPAPSDDADPVPAAADSTGSPQEDAPTGSTGSDTTGSESTSGSPEDTAPSPAESVAAGDPASDTPQAPSADGAATSIASGVTPDGALTASEALIRFVEAVLASTGFAAPDLALCICTVAVSVGVGGDAHAVAVGGTVAGAKDGSGALRSGDSGPALAVSVSADGPAEAQAASGDTGGSGGQGGAESGERPDEAVAATAPRGVTSAGRARVPQQKLDDAVRELVDSLLRAARERAAASSAELGGYEEDLSSSIDHGLVAMSTATISIDLEVWSPTNGLRRDGGGCTPDDGSGVTVICAIALAISLGGTADADALPPAGARGTALPTGPGVNPDSNAGWPGDAIAIALSMGARASASADAGDAWVAASYDASPTDAADPTGDDVSATSGSTGSALSASLTVSGSAGSEARSGRSGAVAAERAQARADAARAADDARTGGSGGSSSASGSSGDTGDSLALSLGRGGADSSAASGDSGDVLVDARLGDAGVVDNRVAGYDASALSPGTGGSADAHGASGSTGWSHTLTFGQTSSATSASGASGGVHARAHGGTGGGVLVLDAGPNAIPTGGGAGGSATIEGASGTTGSALAIGVADGRDVVGRSTSGHSGLVDVLATGGTGGCAALRSDLTDDPCVVRVDPPAPQAPTTVTTPSTPDVVVVAPAPAPDAETPVTVVARSSSSRSLTFTAPAPGSPSSSSSDGSAALTGSTGTASTAFGTTPSITATDRSARLDSAPVAYRTGAEPQGKDNPDVKNPRGRPANPAGVVLALITSLAIVLATVAMLIKYVKIKSARRRPRRT